MTVHVINLDRDTERLETFLTRNAHLSDIVRIPAVDGRAADRKSLHELGMISPDLTYTNGNLGSALSHIKLWRRVVKDNCVLTIAEDDAVFARNFNSAHEVMLRRLPEGWDFILWGWNFDRPLWTEVPEGVAASVMQFDQDALRANIEIFRKSEILPTLFRLRHAFGAMGYSVSPTGAKTLLDICLPLSAVDIHFTDKQEVHHNAGIDCVMNAAYPLMKSYVCLPPLVVSENRHETSRTRQVF